MWRAGVPRQAQGAVAGTLTRPVLGALLLLLAAAAAADEPARITLPPGFRIDLYAKGFGATRFMTLDPAGTLLVSTPREGRVVALPGTDRDGRADHVVTVVAGLDLPHGLPFQEGWPYSAETGSVRRFRYDPASRRTSDPALVVPSLPPRGAHGARRAAFGAAA